MARLLPEVRPHYGKLELFIGGRRVESETDTWLPVYNPAKDEVIAEVPFATREEIEEAVASAREAYEKWSEVPITERIQYLFALKNKLEEYKEELARTIVQNHGKTIAEARGDMRRAIENVEAAIAAGYTLAKGEHMDQVAEGIDETLVREPLGVFLVITPFNFPTMIPMWFIPYALITGNTVVLKPSEITPVPVNWMYKVFEEAGLPPGVVNVVHGAREAVEQLISHKDIVGVAFVGSTPVGRLVYEMASRHGKRALVQAGAKNFLVVMPDANIEGTVPALIGSFFGNAGQRCLAGANLVPVGEAYDRVVKPFLEAASKLKLGYGLDETVDMGPVVSRRARERIISYIDKGVEEGAKLLLDGRKANVPEYPRGYFVGPTVFDEVHPDMTIAREEIFGPVASIIRAETLDDAIEMINENPYGNAASIFTSSGRVAREFRRRVNVGNIGINIGVAAPMAFFPFAGRKDSFFGVLHGQIDSIDFFTDKKVVITRWW